MNELDKRRWLKVERLSDKVSYVLEAVTRLRSEVEAWRTGEDLTETGVLLEIAELLWDVAEHADVKEARDLFKVIANTRTDRRCYIP
jgi:hypothetical protein